MDAVSSDSPAGRVRLDRETRQRQIIEVYTKLIAEEGYSSTSLRDLATRAEISTGTLLHHFASKQDLLVATLLTISNDFLAHMRDAVAGGGDAVETLRRVVRAVFETPRHDLGWRVWISFWHEASTHSELQEVASGRTALSESIVTDVIAEGAAAGSLNCPDPAACAEELAALIDGVAIRLYSERGSWDLERALRVCDRAIEAMATSRGS